MKRFRVWLKRSGVAFQPTYYSTVAGALKAASARGFLGHTADKWDVPNSAEIARRHEYHGRVHFEAIAYVSGAGVKAVPLVELTMHRQLLAQLEKVQAAVAETEAIYAELTATDTKS